MLHFIGFGTRAIIIFNCFIGSNMHKIFSINFVARISLKIFLKKTIELIEMLHMSLSYEN